MKKLVIMMIMVMMTTVAISATESKYTAEEKTAVMSVYWEKNANLKKAKTAYYKKTEEAYNAYKEAYAKYKEAYAKYTEAYAKYTEAREAYKNSNKEISAARKLIAARDSYKFYKNNLTRKNKALKKAQNKLDKAYECKEKSTLNEVSKDFNAFCDENADILKEKFGGFSY